MRFHLNLRIITVRYGPYSKIDKAIMLVELRNSISINVDEFEILAYRSGFKVSEHILQC